jgi:hypothetical protein
LPSSVATVQTATPERYAKQLASHLGHKLEVRPEEAGDRLVFGAGSCLLEPRADVLVLSAVADDPDALEQVQRVVGSHLERFGQRNELTVSWEASQ